MQEVWISAAEYEKLRDTVDEVVDDLTIISNHMDPHLLITAIEKLKKAIGGTNG